MICVQMRHECWTRHGSLSFCPWKSVCHDWTATDATHNCMPGCESILAVTASWLICVWILFMWCQKLEVSSMVVYRDEGTTEMLSRGSRINPSTWDVMCIYPTRQCFRRLCHRTHLYSNIWHSDGGKMHWNWTCFETCSILGLYVQ